MPHLYIGSNGLSLWTSADNGETLSRMSTGTGLYSGSQVWSLATHPSRPNDLLVGADTGIHRLDRASGACRLLPSPMDGMLVTAIAYAPSDADTIFAGTQPAGLYRSTDAGQHWRKLDAAMKPHVATGFPGYGAHWERVPLPAEIQSSVYFMATNAADSMLIFVATNLGQLFRSTDGGESWVALKRRLGEIRTMTWLPD